jgi:predicted nucleic acid-binding protein
MSAPAPVGVVLDASAAVALLVDDGPIGQWVVDRVARESLFAPDLMPFEAANVLRRQVLAGVMDATAATLAHADLLALPVDLYPYAGLADRTWQMRQNLSCYDASYVSLAELFDVTLITLDARLARAPGTRCTILAYPGG